MSLRDNDKTTRYVGLLDEARLHGSWDEVPELVRKIDKHTSRKCLTLTASIEAQISTNRARPASSTGSSESESKLAQALKEKATPSDIYQAKSCLLNLYFLRKAWDLITGYHDEAFQKQSQEMQKDIASQSGWTRVCMIKSRYFLAVAQEEQGRNQEAQTALLSAVPLINNASRDIAMSSEWLFWSEKLLSRACSIAMAKDGLNTLDNANRALVTFRTWARCLDLDSSSAYKGTSSDIPRRRTWSLYYNLLSFILACDLAYTDSAEVPLALRSAGKGTSAGRSKQRIEIKRVEATYEALILQQTQFPNATQSNQEVERWTNQVMANWRIFCGSDWSNTDNGQGGKEAVSRGVLDILYRAASKTFHSTVILRHLFAVHASVAEFDLAIKAFDTYAEIVGKGKARVEKTGNQELGIDSDEEVFITAAEAVRLLCFYGSREQGEKALEIGKRVSQWLQSHRPSDAQNNGTNGDSEKNKATAPSDKALSAAYRAIGQSQANWAKLTYEPAQRNELQMKARSNLRQSLSYLESPAADPDLICVLATLLADLQEIQPAIQIVKSALSATTQAESDLEGDAITKPSPAPQKLVPLWHLLGLLLTARGEHDSAVGVCAAAFDQLSDFSPASPPSPQSPRNGEKESSSGTNNKFKTLGDVERECLIQLKMTEIELLGVVGGQNAATDRSFDVLALFARFYGDPARRRAAQPSKPAPQQPAVRPKTSSGGTIKSLRGSILGRPKSLYKNPDKPTPPPADFEKPAGPANAAVTDPPIGPPITIQVTNEHDQVSKEHHKHHLPHHIPHHPLHHGHHKERPKSQAGAEPLQPRTAEKVLEPATDVQAEKPTDTTLEPSPELDEKQASNSRPDKELRGIAHNINPKKIPPPPGHTDQPPRQDVRLPAPHPTQNTPIPPRYAAARQWRHSVALLIQVWLFVANVYIKGELIDDAKGAIDEASKLVEDLQEDIAKEDSSARAFDTRDFGATRSVGALWGDVWALRGDLAAAQATPHDAIAAYEQALSHCPDHPAGIVGLSSLLMDIYEQKIPVEPPHSSSHLSSITSPLQTSVPSVISTETQPDKVPAALDTAPAVPHHHSRDPTPAELNRLAARDRAYLLLATLTKLGDGWDNAEAWFLLSRAHELSGQTAKARECLWWVIQLEDVRPIRHWRCVHPGLS